MSALAVAAACSGQAPRTAVDVTESARTVAIAPPLAPVLDSLPPVPAAVMTRDQHRGQTLYASLCSSCHGPYGHGDGPSARGFPGSLPDLAVASREPDARLVARMQLPYAGGAAAGAAAGAPTWHALSPESLRLVVGYLRILRPTGSRGNAAVGRLLYASYCVQCHGVSGRGDGRLAAGFLPQPADLHLLRLAGREARVLETIRAGGSRDHRMYMPDWGLVLSDERLWDVVAYLAVYRAML